MAETGDPLLLTIPLQLVNLMYPVHPYFSCHRSQCSAPSPAVATRSLNADAATHRSPITPANPTPLLLYLLPLHFVTSGDERIDNNVVA